MPPLLLGDKMGFALADVAGGQRIGYPMLVLTRNGIARFPQSGNRG